MTKRRRNETPQKQAMREMMKEYLKGNDISVKDGTDVNAIMRDMMSVILEGSLDEELDEELGYSKYDYKNKETNNNRNINAIEFLIHLIPNQVWSIDITYIKTGKSHQYLTAIIDWHSRYIIGWNLSETLDTSSVILAVNDAIKTHGTPCYISSDQGNHSRAKNIKVC